MRCSTEQTAGNLSNTIFENFAPAPDGAVYSGKESISHFWQDFFHGLSHVQIEVEEVFGFGERCVMRWRYIWVKAGEKKGYIRGVDLFRVRNGFIHERLSYIKGNDG